MSSTVRKVQKSTNSLTITIPYTIVQNQEIKAGDYVEMKDVKKVVMK